MRTVMLAVVLVAVAGCAPGPTPAPTTAPMIDTWPIGPAYQCTDELWGGTPGICDELLRVGLAGLDERNPGHAAVVQTELHAEGALVNPSTGVQALPRSGPCCSVLVFKLADGTTRAIGVGAPGIGPLMAIPWEIDPSQVGQ